MSDDSKLNVGEVRVGIRRFAYICMWHEIRLKKTYQAISDHISAELEGFEDRISLILKIKGQFDKESPERKSIEQAYEAYENKRRIEVIGYCTKALLTAHHEAYRRSGIALSIHAQATAEREGGVLGASNLFEEGFLHGYEDEMLEHGITYANRPIESLVHCVTTIYSTAMYEGLMVEESIIEALTYHIMSIAERGGLDNLYSEFTSGSYLDHIGRPKSYWVEQVLGNEL